MEKSRKKLTCGRLVSCNYCGTHFEIPYRINKTRAQNPKFCSKKCFSNEQTKRALSGIGERFWSKVKKGKPHECWLWTGALRAGGYGWFNYKGRPTNASRIAYIITNGELPSHIFVCHSCDNPACCNPNHLWPGTASDNNRDRDIKGRGNNRHPNVSKEERHPSAKLDRQKVAQAYTSKISAVELALLWGVTPQAIHAIRKGKNWKSVTESLNAP
jgi:hypothetical protein